MTKADKKGKKRGLDEGNDESTGGTGWQSKYDSLRIHAAKLQKLVDGKGKGKSYGKKAWNGSGGGSWGGGYGGSWNTGYAQPWKGGGSNQSWTPPAADKGGKGKNKGKK